MSDIVVDAPPLIIEKPFVRVGPIGSGVDLSCPGTNLEVGVDQDENTIETFCGSFTSYKAEKWTITLTVIMTYGAEGVWNALRPLVGTYQPFEIRPQNGAGSVDNPSMTGTALIKAFEFINAAPGAASEIDLVFAVQGEPVWTPPGDTMSASASTSSTDAPASAAA